MTARLALLALLSVLTLSAPSSSQEPRSVSGIYPSLAMFNDESECGTGAIVPWAERLWVVTYAPHKPFGSTDRLYEITPELHQINRPESVGGTPANRMIHAESGQLAIGPYLIDNQRRVRVIPPTIMPGRLTGTARHLFDPANKLYYATMEEGLYEVDVHNLKVSSYIRDGNNDTERREDQPQPPALASRLPGYHGKGFYSGQGRAVYANNGEHGAAALRDPTTPSGALAEWYGKPGEDWRLVRRDQFTEITGPGGINGNANPETDPIWTIGWDVRSLILMVLDAGQWRAFRLPKASHSYDGAHGWNTEWPRIREIGESDLLMTMHGTFWRFPASFSPKNSAGIAPRSNYLKVVGDFCRWQDRIVLGCDDSARSEFLNKRKAKGEIAATGRSQSNLWFVSPEQLDHLGPAIGRGALWLNDPVKAGQPSDPYLFAGYDHRSLVLSHDDTAPLAITIEVDERGDSQWQTLLVVQVNPGQPSWVAFTPKQAGAWVRLTTDREASRVTAFFHYRNRDDRMPQAAAMFEALARPGDPAVNGGLLHARGADFKTLRYLAQDASGEIGCYDLDGDLRLKRVDDPQGAAWTGQAVAIPSNVLTIDEASVLYIDDDGTRYRLPRSVDFPVDPGVLGESRVCREVCTERDLFNAHGTFYELPATNAGGFRKIRPIASHGRALKDYASYRGLLVLSGLANQATASEHVVKSEDGRCSLWVGAVDDLWQLGKPRGVGGPWHNTPVTAGNPSDPYLMTGYDHRAVSLSHASAQPVAFKLEADVAGDGRWLAYQTILVQSGETAVHKFPEAFTAYWFRVVTDRDTTATATFTYE